MKDSLWIQETFPEMSQLQACSLVCMCAGIRMAQDRLSNYRHALPKRGLVLSGVAAWGAACCRGGKRWCNQHKTAWKKKTKKKQVLPYAPCLAFHFMHMQKNSNLNHSHFIATSSPHLCINVWYIKHNVGVLINFRKQEKLSCENCLSKSNVWKTFNCFYALTQATKSNYE